MRRNDFVKLVTGEAKKKHEELVKKAMKIYEEAKREDAEKRLSK